MLDNVIGSIPSVAFVTFVVLALACLGVFVYIVVGLVRRRPDRDNALLAGGLALIALGGAIACAGIALLLGAGIGNWFILIASVSTLIGLVGGVVSRGAVQRIQWRLDEAERQITQGRDQTRGSAPR